MATFDVYGMCNPLFDLQAEISDSLLDELGYAKGSMSLIGHEDQRALLPKVYEHLVNTEPGGSGANTMITLGLLGGHGAFSGHVGLDEHARMYSEGLVAAGIRPILGASDGHTGLCVVLVTPDTERTMCTFLGKAQDLCRADVSAEDIRASKYLYVTGYLWDTDQQKDAVRHAMQIANEAGIKVAFSLSDPFCVHRHREDFLELIRGHVDVLFGNDAEVLALTGASSVGDAIDVLESNCELVVVTLNSEGSVLRSRSDSFVIPPFRVKPVDTTGAGDAYAAGILYGLSQNLPLEATGRIASYVAAKVVEKLGPRLSSIDPEAVRKLKNGADLVDLQPVTG